MLRKCTRNRMSLNRIKYINENDEINYRGTYVTVHTLVQVPAQQNQNLRSCPCQTSRQK